MEKPLNIIFLGISGSGKGMQVRLLKQKLEKQQHVFVIGMGDLMRSLARKSTDTGTRIKEVLRNGNLVPSPVALAYWLHEVSTKVSQETGIMTDGSPRSVWEAQAIDVFLDFLDRKEKTRVLWLNVSEDVVAERLLMRGRADDHKEAIAGRFTFFREHVMPTVAYYKQQNRLIEINGGQPIKNVHEDIIKALGF